MPKDKQDKPESSEKEELVLTEWQKRNLEFQKKRKEHEEEQKQLSEKLRLEKRRQYHLEPEDEEVDDPKKNKRKAPKPKKNQKAKPKKPTRGEKRRAKAKKRAKNPRNRARPLLYLAIPILLISIFFLTPFSKQKTVTVSGAKNTASETVISAAKIKANDYITQLILHHKTYEQSAVANDEWVKSASLTYKFPNQFNFAIKEFSIYAYAQTNSGYQPILENGQLTTEPFDSSKLPSTYLTVNLSDKKMIKQLVSTLQSMPKSLVSQIQIVRSAGSKTTTDLLNIEMRDGNTVLVPLSTLANKLPYYNTVKKNLIEISTVDMEVGVYTTTGATDSAATSQENTQSSDTQTTEESSTTQAETTTEQSTQADQQVETTIDVTATEQSSENTAETAQ